MKAFIATIALLSSSLLAEAQVSLLTGPIVNPANGHSYYLTTPTTWTNAEAFARAMGVGPVHRHQLPVAGFERSEQLDQPGGALCRHRPHDDLSAVLGR